jgi:hypothetical protein
MAGCCIGHVRGVPDPAWAAGQHKAVNLAVWATAAWALPSQHGGVTRKVREPANAVPNGAARRGSGNIRNTNALHLWVCSSPSVTVTGPPTMSLLMA